MSRYGRTPLERFWNRVEKTESCWLWTGTKTQSGYGQMGYAGRNLGAHRVAYLMFVGPYPDGYELDHLCRVRNCVNPEHLEPVTRAENMRRAADARPRVVTRHYERKERAVLTHCRKGHEYVPGTTNCRICESARNRRKYVARMERAGITVSAPANPRVGLAERADSHAAHLERVRLILRGGVA